MSEIPLKPQKNILEINFYQKFRQNGFTFSAGNCLKNIHKILLKKLKKTQILKISLLCPEIAFKKLEALS